MARVYDQFIKAAAKRKDKILGMAATHSIIDIAKAVGVSPQYVGRVINEGIRNGSIKRKG